MIDVAINAFVTLFMVIDPIGMMPIVLALSHGISIPDRRRMVVAGIKIATLVLLGFALVGQGLLDLLGITLPAFRIAGGLMLLLIALEMVFQRRMDRRSRAAQEATGSAGADDYSVFPLAIPLLAGPGAITSVMLLMADHKGDLTAQAVVVSMLLAVMTLCLLILQFIDPLERMLGRTLTHVLFRVLGVLLGALAVQYVMDGLADGIRQAL